MATLKKIKVDGVEYDIGGVGGGGSAETYSYELNDLKGSSWLRVAKVTDITKNSSGLMTIDTAADKKITTVKSIDLNSNPTLTAGNKYSWNANMCLQELINNNGTIELIVNDEVLHTTDKSEMATYFSENYSQSSSYYENHNDNFYSFLLVFYRGDMLQNLSKIVGSITITNERTDTYEIDYELGDISGSIMPQETVELPFSFGYGGNVSYFVFNSSRIQCTIQIDLDLTACEYKTSGEFTLEEDTVVNSYSFMPNTMSFTSTETVVTYKKAPLTFSTFNLVCGLNEKGQFVSDVMPIVQAPELGGSGSSGGGSGDVSGSGDSGVSSASVEEEEVAVASEDEGIALTSDSGSVSSDTSGSTGDTGGSAAGAGSGASTSYGIAAVKFERYEGEIYACVLLNYPATDALKNLYAEIKIENNLNLELLESLEPVELDEVEYRGEGQVLEGMTFKGGSPYNFSIKGNLGALYDGLNSEDPLYPIDIKLNDDYTLIKHGKTVDDFGYVAWYGIFNNCVDENLYRCQFVPLSGITDNSLSFVSGGDFTVKRNILKTISGSFEPQNPTIVQNKITKASGTIMLPKNSIELDNFEVYINGNIVEPSYNEETDCYEIVFNNVTEGQDLFELTVLDGSMWGGIAPITLDIYNCEYEITIPVTFEEDVTVDTLTIANNDIYNFQLRQVELVKHYTTDSYDLYSPYNMLEKLAKDVNSATIVAYTARGMATNLRNYVYNKMSGNYVKTLSSHGPGTILTFMQYHMYNIYEQYVSGDLTDGAYFLPYDNCTVNLSGDGMYLLNITLTDLLTHTVYISDITEQPSSYEDIVITTSGGLSGGVEYTAGDGITISEDNVISVSYENGDEGSY